MFPNPIPSAIIWYFVSDQQLEGADSRKRSVEAGLIETVLKLVDSPEPIQVQDLFSLCCRCFKWLFVGKFLFSFSIVFDFTKTCCPG